MLTVELCGRLADPYGPQLRVGVALPCTMADLRAAIAQGWPALAEAMASPRVRACVNEVLVDDTALAQAGALVAFFPPVSGG